MRRLARSRSSWSRCGPRGRPRGETSTPRRTREGGPRGPPSPRLDGASCLAGVLGLDAVDLAVQLRLLRRRDLAPARVVRDAVLQIVEILARAVALLDRPLDRVDGVRELARRAGGEVHVLDRLLQVVEILLDLSVVDVARDRDLLGLDRRARAFVVPVRDEGADLVAGVLGLDDVVDVAVHVAGAPRLRADRGRLVDGVVVPVAQPLVGERVGAVRRAGPGALEVDARLVVDPVLAVELRRALRPRGALARRRAGADRVVDGGPLRVRRRDLE